MILADARAEVAPNPDDPGNTSAFTRAFLRAPAPAEEVAGWYSAQLQAAGWALLSAPPEHPQHWRFWGRDNLRFSLFIYDRSPFAREGQGVPGPADFEKPGTVHQVFFEARAAGFGKQE